MELIKAGKYYIHKKFLDPNITQYISRCFRYYNPVKDETKISFSMEGDYLTFPRNSKKIKSFIDLSNVIDKTVFPKSVKPLVLSDSFKLKDNQKIVMTKVLKELSSSKDNSVILKAEPGFGKSYTLPYVVSKLQTNTLVIVDRTNLAIQMEGEFRGNCSDLDLIILGGDNKSPASVTIATFQFLIKNLGFISEYKDFFGLIVVDECHVIGSDVFTTIVGKFNAKYRVGLSATPTRSDYMTDLLIDVMGSSRVEGKSDDTLNVHILKVDHPASFYGGRGSQYKKLYSAFLHLRSIVNDILFTAKSFHQLNRKGLIYITEVSAQETYAIELKKLGLRVGVVNQKTPQTQRLEYFNLLEAEELDIIISGSILQKGISIKRLDYIINLANLTKEGYEQLVGRLRRHHPTKKPPLFIDFMFQASLFEKGIMRSGFANNSVKNHGDKTASLTMEKFKTKIQSELRSSK